MSNGDSIEKLITKLQDNEIVAVFCNAAKLKLEFAIELVKQCVNRKLPVSYLDFDLQLSALIRNISEEEYVEISTGGLFDLMQPAEHEIESSFVSIATNSMRQGGFIILDSANMIQNLLSKSSLPSDQIVANHKSAVLISLLQQLGRKYRKTILILALTRARPKQFPESASWEKEMVGGRIMKFKADLILFLREANEPSSGEGPRLVMELGKWANGARENAEELYRISLS